MPRSLENSSFVFPASSILRCNVAAIFFSICMLRHLLTNKIRRQRHPVNANFSTFVTSFRHHLQKIPGRSGFNAQNEAIFVEMTRISAKSVNKVRLMGQTVSRAVISVFFIMH